jgi:hypothetical protein
MHVYRNREYEEEIVMLMWHKKGGQRMVETSKQKRHTGTSQDNRKRNTDTHKETNKRLRTRHMIQGESGIFSNTRINKVGAACLCQSSSAGLCYG